MSSEYQIFFPRPSRFCADMDQALAAARELGSDRQDNA
jgi:hypothetical protein